MLLTCLETQRAPKEFETRNKCPDSQRLLEALKRIHKFLGEETTDFESLKSRSSLQSESNIELKILNLSPVQKNKYIFQEFS